MFMYESEGQGLIIGIGQTGYDRGSRRGWCNWPITGVGQEVMAEMKNKVRWKRGGRGRC